MRLIAFPLKLSLLIAITFFLTNVTAYATQYPLLMLSDLVEISDAIVTAKKLKALDDSIYDFEKSICETRFLVVENIKENASGEIPVIHRCDGGVVFYPDEFSKYLLFLVKKGKCYRLVNGPYAAVLFSDNHRAITEFIDEEPSSQSMDSFESKIKRLMITRSKLLKMLKDGGYRCN